jgi:hypothetical protein
MKRAFAAAVTVAAASISIGLAAVPAYAKPAPSATLTVTPKWTYSDGGKFAVSAKCSVRSDLRVVFSPLLYHPVTVPGAGNLLIRVTGKSKAGRYTIGLLCVDRHSQADSVAVKTVTVRKQLFNWTASPPSLPRHFKPDLTVQTGMRQVIVSSPVHRPSRRSRVAKHR